MPVPSSSPRPRAGRPPREEQPADPPRAAGSGGGLIPATKLHIPRARPELVPHHRLIARLVTERAKLTLVSAPPGAGKTTLVSVWSTAPGEARPFAWLSLDEADSDPVRFWDCAIGAVQSVIPGFGTEALSWLPARGASLTRTALPPLINELSRLTVSLVLVLDDYHAIADGAVHETVDYLLDHCPENFHLVLITRSNPPLALARLRTRGELAEVREADLRCSQEQATALLNGVLGLSLTLEEVRVLRRRTEGWAAGLQLAGLSLRGAADRHRFIADFAGDDRHIFDFLGSEVLDGQPSDVRDFLTRTSILDQLSAPLCDAVAGPGSADALETIERANLFLIPLDNRREWYRYHHLFRELLRHELSRSDPEAVPVLHRRAREWYQEQGAVPEAIRHATAGDEVAVAADLIAEHWNGFFNAGRLATVAGWLDALPEGAVAADGRLSVARAWLALDSGRLDEVGTWIESAEQAAEAARGRNGGDGAPLECQTAALRAVHRYKAGDVGAADATARAALDRTPPDAAFERTVATCVLGISLYWAGDPAASGALGDAAQLADGMGNDLAFAYATGFLALLELERDEVGEAERLARVATDRSDQPGFAEHFVLAIPQMALAAVFDRHGVTGPAEAAARRALELSRRGGGLVEIGAALLGLAGVLARRGEAAEARPLVDEAAELVARCPDPGRVIDGLERARRALTRTVRRPTGGEDELSERELAVLRLLPGELSLREIGGALYLSHNTIKTHTRSIYRKLGVTGREDAVTRSRELGLL